MVALNIAATTAATIVKFVAFISARNYDPLPGFFAVNATWWSLGNPNLAGDSGGSQDAVEHVTVLKNAKVYENYSFTIKNQVTEGHKSIIEGQVHGQGPQGLDYLNNITMAFTLDEHHKITQVHEYYDRIEVNYLLQFLRDHNLVSRCRLGGERPVVIDSKGQSC
jgi:ketosteroid isomerase-like protein